MRVVAKKILRNFWEKHEDCEQQLKAWFREAQKAEWENPNQIKKETVFLPLFGLGGGDRDYWKFLF